MPRIMKHLVAAVLLAGGVLLAGTSFVGAHIPGGDPNSCYTPSRPLKIRVIPETRTSRMYDFLSQENRVSG